LEGVLEKYKRGASNCRTTSTNCGGGVGLAFMSQNNGAAATGHHYDDCVDDDNGYNYDYHDYLQLQDYPYHHHYDCHYYHHHHN
jgi:hypothetical protein